MGGGTGAGSLECGGGGVEHGETDIWEMDGQFGSGIALCDVATVVESSTIAFVEGH